MEEHINTRNGSLWRWNDPTFDYYVPNLKKHPSFIWAGTQQRFEQPNVPQSSEDNSATGTLECVKSSDNMQVDARIEEPLGEDYNPMEETGNLEISPESVPTQVYTPHILFQ